MSSQGLGVINHSWNIPESQLIQVLTFFFAGEKEALNERWVSQRLEHVPTVGDFLFTSTQLYLLETKNPQ